MPAKESLLGQRFGSLEVIAPAPSRSNKTYWKCRCDCGSEKEIQTSHLKSGSTKTCGCKIGIRSNGDIVTCVICNKQFNLIKGSTSRKYCYDCSPTNVSDSKRITIFRNAMKKEAVKKLGGKCIKCGYDRCLDALQFHHINPNEKEFTLGKNKSISWEKYWEEAQKCELLCANCHAEEHYKLNQIENE